MTLSLSSFIKQNGSRKKKNKNKKFDTNEET